jgi:hypothetical protein
MEELSPNMRMSRFSLEKNSMFRTHKNMELHFLLFSHAPRFASASTGGKVTVKMTAKESEYL